MYHEDEDLHMCIYCHTTIVGLENYISHRNSSPCKSQHPVKANEAPIPVLPPLDLQKAERIRPVPSATSSSNGEHLNFLNAGFFFSSLELQSRRKDAVFEEVMGIEEVLEEEYDERENGGQRTVYSSGGKWGYEDYASEREIWPSEVERGGKGEVGMDREGEERQAEMEEHQGSGYRVEDIDLETKTETCKEKDKQSGGKSKVNICETDENNHGFDENLDTGINYAIRDDSPTKPNDDMLRPSVMEMAPPVEAVDICMSGTGKESGIGEFDISLDNCNLVIDSLSSKEEDEHRYKSSSSVPPSGHTRGKWVPGLASQGIRKSGNAVEYYCQPCNKNIRNRRSYEAHLSTSCHLKKLMRNTDGGVCASTSEGRRLRSRRLQLSKMNSTSDSLTGSSLPHEKTENGHASSCSDSQNYLMESLGIKRKVSKTEDNLDIKTHNSKITRVSGEVESKGQLPHGIDEQIDDVFAVRSDSRKRRNLKSKSKVSNKSCKNSVGKISDTLDAQYVYGHDDGSAVNVNSTVSKCSLPTVHSVKMSGKSSLRNLIDRKDSLTDVINGEVVSLEKETENTSVTDVRSLKYPLVNLGYRCDSVKFQQEQEKMKANVDSEKGTYNSALQSSDKNLQDEMMLGLELIRTDHYLSSDGKSKKYELKTSELNQYDYGKQEEVSDETKTFDSNNSSFPSTETTEVGVNCKKATDCEDSYFGEEVIDKVGVGPCESVEDFGCDMQREEIVVDSGRMEHDLTSNSETCYHAESKKINVRESNSTSHEAIVNNLSKTATVATQTVTAPSFELENSIKVVEHVKESLTLTPNDLDLTLPNTSFKLPADKTSSLQIPSKRHQYFTLKRVGSKVIFVKKLNQRDFPSSEGRSSLKKNQIPKFSETESPSVQNHSKRGVKTIASNIENKADKILENAYLLSIPSKTSYKVNNEDPLSSENPKKELLPVKPFSATLIKIVKPSFEAKLDKIDVNSAITAGSQLRPEVINILDECESLVEKRNKINHETVKKEAEIRHKGNVSEDVVPCVKRMGGSTSKDSIHRSKQMHVFEVKGSERANLAQDLRKNGENGKHITNRPILHTASKQNKLNEAGDKRCEDNKNASQTLNIVINVDSKYCKLANNVTADLMNGNHLLSQAPKNPIIPKPKTAIIDGKFPEKGLFSAEFSNPLPSTNAETSNENCALQRFMKLNEDNLFSNEQNSAKYPEANKLGAGLNISKNENVMEFQNKAQREEANGHPLVIWNKKPASETNNVKTVGAKLSKFMLITKILDKNNKTPEKPFDEKEKVLEEKRESNSTSEKALLVDPSDQIGDEIQEIDIPGKPAEKEGGACSGGGSKPVLYVCGLCGYKSTRHWCVERHIVKHLPRLRRFVCQLCNLAFLSLENLKQHMKRHEMKKWGCDFQGCQQFFATKQELLVHLSGLHMTEKTYKCPLCEYSGKNSQALERHKKIHADVEMLVECKVCAKSCKKKNLERHMKMHENVEPFTCPFCDFKSSYLTNIRRHVHQSLVHPGKKLYNCPFCLNKNGKDEEIEHLGEVVTNQFSSDGAHDMLNHINAEHSEEKDLSYKLHCTSKLIRKLQMLLGIYRPTISSINDEGGSTKETKSIEEKEKDNSLEQDCGGSGNKAMSSEDIEMIDADQNVDNSFLDNHGECSSDDVIISCNGNTSVARDSEAIKSKNTLARDQSCSLVTGIPSDAESASYAVSTCSNDKNSCKTRREVHNLDADVQSECFNTILDVTDFMKKKVAASKPDHRNEFLILNSDTSSSLPPAITKERNLTDEDGSTSTTFEELPALDGALVSESEADDDASNSEKGAKICCISNVFTMAESKLTLNAVGGKSRFVNDNIIDSDNTLTDMASNVLAGEETVSSDDCVMIENDVEVEDIKLENDFDTSEGNEELQNPLGLIRQSLILPEHSSDVRMQSSDPGGFVRSYKSNGVEDVSSRNKIRGSQDAMKLTSDHLSKHKRKKFPRWTSEVEVIRKSDGVISLWPASPQLHKHA